MQLLVILYYIYQLSIHSVHCTTNTAYLTTSSPSNNGASVSVLKDTSTSGGKWNIKATDQIGFHVKLTMNSLYAFHATEPSTFTIKIGSDTVTGGNDKDFIASFSQSSSRYVSFEMSIDDAYGNVMYPTCDTTSSYHAFQSGNVKALCDATSGSREAKAVGGSGNYGYFGRSPARTAYPLTWTFVNYPGSHTEMTYSCPGTTATTCGFSPPFASDVPLEVFFATEDDGEEFAITYIDISLTWEPTPNPTSNPTSTPTPKPTPKPTTRDPTTASPTANPSRDPTVTPSRNPTTRDPSTNPTKTPTKGPVTSTQRDRDGEVVEEPSTSDVSPSNLTPIPDHDETTTKQDSDDALNETSVFQNKMYLVVAPAVLLAVCGVIVCLCCRILQSKALPMKEKVEPVSNVVDLKSPAGALPLANNTTHLAKYDTTVEDLELINAVLSYNVNDTTIVTSAVGGFDEFEEIDIEDEEDEYSTGKWSDDDEDVVQEIIAADIIDDDECTPPPNVPECETYNDYDFNQAEQPKRRSA